jgi:hypothetical protein
VIEPETPTGTGGVAPAAAGPTRVSTVCGGARTGRTNRVRPDQTLIAVPDRGLFWGNRGPLLDDDGRLARHNRGRNWIICQLRFNGRHRLQWQPRRLTELYFLDEATALAAGHRPCAECRHQAYQAFKTAWRAGLPGHQRVTAAAIDTRLHADRLSGPGVQRTYRAELAGLPDATIIEHDGLPWLVLGDTLLAWTSTGYRAPRSRAGLREVRVLTPKSTVAALTAGYRPVLHPSAHQGDRHGLNSAKPTDETPCPARGRSPRPS